ncbi:MAG: outer membrane lipoprotein-sorting protein [Gammaproteobacteria bacterium]|nr:outer membrane lipoprotein-sorting protein [Gammaproteobacteria bacterium]
MRTYLYKLLLVALFLCAAVFPVYAEEQRGIVDNTTTAISGLDIVRQCDNKYPGDDQQSQLTITLKDRSGNERKTVYLRLWKDLKGEEGVVDKMVLFTLFPPDAKGAGFMRWAYLKEKEKNAEQWIYLPKLRKIRRVSVRDLGDSFLGSDLTYGDISLRLPEDDQHEFVRIDQDKSNNQFYVIVSKPKGDNSLYSKTMSWYHKTADPQDCVKVRVDYFDRKGSLLKRQMIKWQKVDQSWVWEKVYVQNAQTFHTSFFEVEKVKINSGLDDEWFTERRLRLGID